MTERKREQAIQNMIDDAHTWLITRAKRAQEYLDAGIPHPMYRYALDHCIYEDLGELQWDEARRIKEARLKAGKAIRMLVGENTWEASGIIDTRERTINGHKIRR